MRVSKDVGLISLRMSDTVKHEKWTICFWSSASATLIRPCQNFKPLKKKLPLKSVPDSVDFTSLTWIKHWNLLVWFSLPVMSCIRRIWGHPRRYSHKWDLEIFGNHILTQGKKNLKAIFKVVHNNYPRGILLTAITTRK